VRAKDVIPDHVTDFTKQLVSLWSWMHPRRRGLYVGMSSRLSLSPQWFEKGWRREVMLAFISDLLALEESRRRCKVVTGMRECKVGCARSEKTEFSGLRSRCQQHVQVSNLVKVTVHQLRLANITVTRDYSWQRLKKTMWSFRWLYIQFETVCVF
jgi:hypothetical protein